MSIGTTRYDQNDYTDALEAVDDDELDPLVEFTARLHRRAVLEGKATPTTNGPRLTSDRPTSREGVFH